MPTSQLIVTSRFIRSGTKKSKARRANYTKYIATRESVEKRPQSNTAVTSNQTQLINKLLKEFPIAKTYLEYEDYTTKPTAENASELISTIIERHADVIGNRKNFVDYMAKRPGAERRGSHGLFNGSDVSCTAISCLFSCVHIPIDKCFHFRVAPVFSYSGLKIATLRAIIIL